MEQEVKPADQEGRRTALHVAAGITRPPAQPLRPSMDSLLSHRSLRGNIIYTRAILKSQLKLKGAKQILLT